MPTTGLRRVIGHGGYFALAFGSIVGSAWVLLLGEWLAMAGPGGASLAFIAGGAVMVLVGLCYAELASRLPRAGAEFLYVREGLGRQPAAIVGWFLTLFLVAFCAFEGIALGTLIEALLPAARGTTLYSVQGTAVTDSGIVIGIVGALAIGGLNLGAVAGSVGVQKLVTAGFIGLSLVLIGLGMLLGDSANLAPAFARPDGRSWAGGALWIFATCAVLFNGYQAALYAIEERAPDVTLRGVVASMLAGIVAAAAFYTLIVLAAAQAMPWAALVGTPLPAVTAFAALTPGRGLGVLVLVAALVSLLKTWNALLMMVTRLLIAQSRAGLLPPALQVLAGNGAPAIAVYWVTGLSMAGMLLGRGGIVPILGMSTICVAVTAALCLGVLLRLRRTDPDHQGFCVPGGRWVIRLAFAGASAMAGFAVVEPALRGGLPLEWLMILGWGGLGLLLARRQAAPKRMST